MAAIALASSGSFFSSPFQNRVFSSSAMSPGARMPIDCLTTSPAISGTNITSRPSTSCSASSVIETDMVETFSPPGRPKCASSSTLAPLPASSRIVGAEARTRVSSVTRTPSIGRLRSTRTSATLPVRSPRSSRVLNLVMCHSLLPLDGGGIPQLALAHAGASEGWVGVISRGDAPSPPSNCD